MYLGIWRSIADTISMGAGVNITPHQRLCYYAEAAPCLGPPTDGKALSIPDLCREIVDRRRDGQQLGIIDLRDVHPQFLV